MDLVTCSYFKNSSLTKTNLKLSMVDLFQSKILRVATVDSHLVVKPSYRQNSRYF